MGEVVSIGVQLELHPINGDTVWHLFIRSSPRQREPNSLPLQPGHYRMTWLPQTNNWRIEAMDPDDGELLHRARHDHQGRPQQLSAHLQEHELQQLQRGEQAETAIRGARRLVQLAEEDPQRGRTAAASHATRSKGGPPTRSGGDKPQHRPTTATTPDGIGPHHRHTPAEVTTATTPDGTGPPRQASNTERPRPKTSRSAGSTRQSGHSRRPANRKHAAGRSRG